MIVSGYWRTTYFLLLESTVLWLDHTLSGWRRHALTHYTIGLFGYIDVVLGRAGGLTTKVNALVMIATYLIYMTYKLISVDQFFLKG